MLIKILRDLPNGGHSVYWHILGLYLYPCFYNENVLNIFQTVLCQQ